MKIPRTSHSLYSRGKEGNGKIPSSADFGKRNGKFKGLCLKVVEALETPALQTAANRDFDTEKLLQQDSKAFANIFFLHC
ncbi:hypothetical protein AMTR_s00022p00234360 [Amborella trichopoda]|uniref:Uncharacterized protein n=1 Tax=Amborella trichopoda TaxID=13333 RepID=W1PUJ5_AMBTC|nr:hypothetical protein AMTR_s00022p00234360 [Amborella trichopoda]